VIKSFVGGKKYIIGNFVKVGHGMTSLQQQNDRRISLSVGITSHLLMALICDF
jgi:hypothetical protein